MPKEFYTEKDIEDMFKRGVTSFEMNDNVVLTELAYEKANRLGMKLVHEKHDNPPSAPVRPYIAQQTDRRPAAPVVPSGAVSLSPRENLPVAGRVDSMDLQQRIRSAVVARLGNQVDASLLEGIIKRVLSSTGLK